MERKTAGLKEIFIAALPLIARATGGVAFVADADGRCLGGVEPDGTPAALIENSLLELCREAAAQGRPLGVLEEENGGECFAIPIGGGLVLAASNSERVARQDRLFQTLQETLPLIAEVAGGEAVLFDASGRRLYTADPKSRTVRQGPGTIAESCLEAMRTGRSQIGASRTIPGATAVRIPISPTFGFGFNNAYSTSQREKLLDEVQKRRTAKYTWQDIICRGPRLTAPLKLAQSAAPSNSPVIIFGESGTGKELFAQAIHNASARSDKPFVAINCSALPESLVESTFFGYVEGAFTGARRGGQAGLFEQANHGTLLLDEISEAPLDLQAKLLRVLQEHEVRRVGADRSIPVDVRIIATCNRDLVRCMDEGQFRSDLYYRLNVIDIYIPPLRQGVEDIPVLVGGLLEKLARADGVPIPEIDEGAMALLVSYQWPGNVRELRNVMERLVSLSFGEKIQVGHLPPKIVEAARQAAARPEEPVQRGPSAERGAPVMPRSADEPRRATLTDRLAEAERLMLFETLERFNGNREKTARELGISVTTLWRRLCRARAESELSG